jgi:hypothetical protein
MNRTIRNLRLNSITLLSAFAILCLFTATSQAAPRPAAVPDDYVITPFGYFHPSCVQALGEKETVFSDGRVLRADGSVKAAPACDFPHFSPAGEKIEQGMEGVTARQLIAGGETAPNISGWLEYISTTTSTSYGEIAATWTVPAAPSTYAGQTLFFFPGFEDINDVVTIVQPVMQFGPSEAGGGEYWSMASWNCCFGGQTWHSPLKTINAGDTLFGEVLPACPKKKAQSCTTWKIVTEDETIAKKTVLNQSNPDGQTWNWAFGAVAEVYGVSECSDFPANTSLALTVQLYDAGFNQISEPGWTASPAGNGVTPQCSYGLNVTDTVETLEY